jgi:hypothetical protein
VAEEHDLGGGDEVLHDDLDSGRAQEADNAAK